jgi:hypothetical protein
LVPRKAALAPGRSDPGPAQCAVWKKRLRAILGPILTLSKRMSYLGSRAISGSLLMVGGSHARPDLLGRTSCNARAMPAQRRSPRANARQFSELRNFRTWSELSSQEREQRALQICINPRAR